MATFKDSSQEASQELPLPPTFQTVESILDFSNEHLLKKSTVSVIGVIKDYQPPVQTRGPDDKCTLTIVDLSTQYREGLRVNIFLPRDRMPHVSSAGDVVILSKFKAQHWSGYPSLLSNYGSDMTVFHAADIPSWPCVSPDALPKSRSTLNNKLPTSAESSYVTWLSSCLDKTVLPQAQEFQELVEQAMVKKEKYSMLKDLKRDHFYDLIGEVIRLFESDGRGTVYLSDYTAHSLFYDNIGGGNSGSTSRDGDEYGYSKSKPKAAKDWPGPYGKLTIQLTIWEPHITFIREKVKVGDWLMLQNVQVKMGNMGGCLEGFLREDRSRIDRVSVQVMTRPDDPDLIDPRWKDAVRRKKCYWDKLNAEQKRSLEDEEQVTGKRKPDAKQSEKMNSKKRRKLERAAALQKAAGIEQKTTVEKLEQLDLNTSIKSNYVDMPTTSFDDILDKHTAVISGTEHQYSLPFINTNFRANVRVVDYFPHKLQDFSVGRRVTEYDMLSDGSDGESTDLEEDMRQFRAGKGFGGERRWEWRFALQVEQAGNKPGDRMEKIWLVVDNSAAQRLLRQDAVNLHHDEAALTELRDQIFYLWGDLEEKKSAFLKTPEGKALQRGGSEPEDTPKPSFHKKTEVLPPDSDDEDTPRSQMVNGRIPKPHALTERDPNAGSSSLHNEEKTTINSAVLALPINNKGFTCCIRQYGVKVPEQNDSKADAGYGFRWERVFGLFGTMIST